MADVDDLRLDGPISRERSQFVELPAMSPAPSRDPVSGSDDTGPGWLGWLGDDEAPAPGQFSGATEVEEAPPVENQREVETSRDGARAASARVDDPLAPYAADLRRRTAQRRARTRRGAIAVAVAGVAAGAGLVVLGVSAMSADSDPKLPSVETASAMPSAQTWCPTTVEPSRASGNGRGSTIADNAVWRAGAAQVFELEYQMYIARNAEAARALIAPSAQAAPIEATRTAINSTPAGTDHCVYLKALEAGRFAVTVDEKWPDQTVKNWDLVVTTAIQPDGRTLVTAIEPGAGAR